MSLNIRSLSKNLIQLRNIAANFKTDIIALSEIWQPNIDYVKIHNFHEIVAKIRPGDAIGGGAALYINKNLKFEKVELLNNIKLKILEIVAVKIKTEFKTEITIVAAYRTPNTSLSAAFTDIETILQATNTSNTIIVGDINTRLGSRAHLLDETSGVSLVQTCIANQLALINNLKISE